VKEIITEEEKGIRNIKEKRVAGTSSLDKKTG